MLCLCTALDTQRSEALTHSAHLEGLQLAELHDLAQPVGVARLQLGRLLLLLLRLLGLQPRHVLVATLPHLGQPLQHS